MAPLMALTGCTLLAAVVAPPCAHAQVPGANHVQLVADLRGFAGPVTDLSFSPDGKFLAACGEKAVRIYQVRTGRLLKTLRGQIDAGSYGDCLAVSFSPDNCFLVVGISSYTRHGSLRVYDTDDFNEIHELVPGHELPVTRLAFSHDGRYLATADSKGEVQIIDWPLRKIVGRSPPLDAKKPGFAAFGFPVGELFLLVSEAGGNSVISVPAGRRLGPDPRVPPRVAQWIDNQTKVEFPEEGRLDVFDVRLDRDAWLAAGRGKTSHWVGCWHGAAARPGKVYRGHRQSVTALALDPECRTAASGDAFGEVHLWDVATGEVLHRLASLGQPIFRAALDQKNRRIGFSTRPAQGKDWTYNHFGRIDHVFDLERRGVFSAPDQGFPEEITQRGRASLKITHDSKKNRFGFQVTDDTGKANTIWLGAGVVPSCFTLLEAGRLGAKAPIVAGTYDGGLFGYDAAAARQRRNFHGHWGQITATTPSADGALLTTASVDRTVRLWSLAPGKPGAWVGFEHAGERVVDVPSGSPAEKAGIRAGDLFVAMDGRPLSELSAMQAQGRFAYEVGQRVTLTMGREGVGYEAEIPLAAGPELVDPLLSLLVTGDGRWCVWTPEGYYDASPGAGDLVGFHINRGVDRAARFVPVHQFRSQLYRPDVINHVFASSNVQQAIAAANETFPGEAPPPIDLRDPEAIESLGPPQVRIISPSEGHETGKESIHLLAEITSQDKQPITDIYVLVNGRPGLEKDIVVVPAEDEGKSRISFNKSITLQPGENAIAVIAANKSATSVPATVTVIYNAPENVKPPKPSLHLLSIGVSNYANARLNLQYAHIDAEKFADAWQNQRGKMYADVATRLMLNEEATSREVRKAMAELLGGATRSDVAVIFISSHGVRDDNLEYYLATHDVDAKKLKETAVHFSDITKLLEHLPCKVLMFVDTCHAAGITGAKAMLRDPLYELSSAEYGAVVFSSSLSRELSMEKEEWGHGAFTKAILDTFASKAADANKDGYLSLTEMEQRVYEEVQKMTEGQQTPVMSRPATIPNLRFYLLP